MTTSTSATDAILDPTTIRVMVYLFLTIASVATAGIIYLAKQVVPFIRTLLELLAFKRAATGDPAKGTPGVFARLEQLENTTRELSSEVRTTSDLLGLSDETMMAAKREVIRRKLGFSESAPQDVFEGVRAHFEGPDDTGSGRRYRGEGVSPSPPPPRHPTPARLPNVVRDPSERHEWDAWGRRRKE